MKRRLIEHDVLLSDSHREARGTSDSRGSDAVSMLLLISTGKSEGLSRDISLLVAALRASC